MIRNFKITPLNTVSLLFFLYGIILFIFGGYTVGNLMVFCLGGVFLFFYLCQTKLPKNKLITSLKIIMISGLIITAALMTFIFFSFGVPKTDNSEDAVIVLGCGLQGSEVSDTLKKRLDTCIEYTKDNPKAIIVVSGGQGRFEEVTEAYAMEQYLLKNNIPKEKIIQEPNSSSTYENFLNSKKLLDDFFKNNPNYKTAFITNRFHCYRAYNLAKNAGLETSCRFAGDEWKSAFSSYLRETLAVIKLWLLGI